MTDLEREGHHIHIRSDGTGYIELFLAGLDPPSEYEGVPFRVNLSAGSFEGVLAGSVDPREFTSFLKECEALYAFESDSAHFRSKVLSITLVLTDLGAITLTGKASPASEANILHFGLRLDQTFLHETIHDLKRLAS